MACRVPVGWLLGLVAVVGAFHCDSLRAGIVNGVVLTGEFSAVGSARGNDGFAFIPSKNLLVSSLGYFDWNGDGLVATHSVGIFRHDPSALGTVIFNSLNPANPAPNDDFGFYSDLFDPNEGKYYDENGFYDGPPKEGIAYYYPGATETPATPPSLVAEVTFSPGEGVLDGGYRFLSIDPVQLLAGERYTIAGFHPGGVDAADDRIASVRIANIETAPELGYLGYNSNLASTLSPLGWETTEFSEYSYIEWGVQYDVPAEVSESFFFSQFAYSGPNMQYSVVPEPSGFMIMFGLGAFVLNLRRRPEASGC